MTTRLADAEGYVTDATIAYFRARAVGGVGLVTVEMASPEKVGRHRARELGIYDDRFLPGLKRLVEAIHAAGAKASIQLGHGGGHTRTDICGEPPIAPSAIPHFVFEVTGETIVPLAMTRERIAESTRAFIAAAVRAARLVLLPGARSNRRRSARSIACETRTGVIGDATRAGRSKEAIAQAFRAALLPTAR
jgi:2,4-dienoyl-CoA reductase-like NADH-dependent reductase (Old Yellow Enzyme family)